jgi:hypothetical protein
VEVGSNVTICYIAGSNLTNVLCYLKEELIHGEQLDSNVLAFKLNNVSFINKSGTTVSCHEKNNIVSGVVLFVSSKCANFLSLSSHFLWNTLNRLYQRQGNISTHGLDFLSFPNSSRERYIKQYPKAILPGFCVVLLPLLTVLFLETKIIKGEKVQVMT